MFLRFLTGLLLALAAATPAAATVITESDAQFSRHWHSPTSIGSDVDLILGTAEKQNAHEFLALTGLATGAQTLSFVFEAPEWARTSYSYSAGGQVLWSTNPFRYAWDGAAVGTFQLSRWSPFGTLDLVLGDDFAGSLYLGFYITHGSDVSWSLSAPSARAPATEAAPVPLPASAGFVLGGFIMLGLFSLARRRLAHC